MIQVAPEVKRLLHLPITFERWLTWHMRNWYVSLCYPFHKGSK